MMFNSYVCFFQYCFCELQEEVLYNLFNKVSYKDSVFFGGCLFKKEGKVKNRYLR